MRFSQAFNPIRALRSSWLMIAAAPVPMLIGGLLLMFTGSGGGSESGRVGLESNPTTWEGSAGGGMVLVFLAVALLVFALLVAWWLFGCLVRVGFAKAAEDVLSRGEASFGQLFEGRGLWGRMVGASLAQILIGIACTLPLMAALGILTLVAGISDLGAAGGVTLAVAILLVVLYVPVIFYVFLGVSLTQPAVAVEGLGPRDALHRSWSLTRGHRLELLIYFIAMAICWFLGLLVCCVGVLFTGPLTQVAFYESYLRLVRSEEEQVQWVIPAG